MVYSDLQPLPVSLSGRRNQVLSRVREFVLLSSPVSVGSYGRELGETSLFTR